LIVAKLTSRIAMVQTLGGAVRVLYSVSKLSSGNQVLCLMASDWPLITSKCLQAVLGQPGTVPDGF
jgi:bifunctional N-acetylglucosamine-1-phosphate-uridyltransferase/glucosamine-1-phosphate-acetyltransferase GlmU-like protein